MRTKHVVVLCAGRIGKAIALDLSKLYGVTVVDIKEKALSGLPKEVEKLNADIANTQVLERIITDANMVVSAVPSFLGHGTLKTLIECGKNVVDIAFSSEDPFLLDELAKRHNVTAAVDCGVCPGTSNLIVGYEDQRMHIETFACYVGGLPVERVWPWQYKAPFAPSDVIEEYTRPARLKENGRAVTKPALSDLEHINFSGLGTLEAFNTDGLRTLLTTMPHIPSMVEKTLRYVGHIDLFKSLQLSGCLSKSPKVINGSTVVPFDVTCAAIFDQWHLVENEHDLTAVQLCFIGARISDGVKESVTYTCLDKYDALSNTTSMARTTGYMATAVARLILENKLTRTGIVPPERIGSSVEFYEFILKHLNDHGVKYNRKIEALSH